LWSHYSTAASRYWQCETYIMLLCLPTGKGALKYCVEQLRLFEMWLYLMCWLSCFMRCVSYVVHGSDVMCVAWGSHASIHLSRWIKVQRWPLIWREGGICNNDILVIRFHNPTPLCNPPAGKYSWDPSSLCEEPACENQSASVVCCDNVLCCILSTLNIRNFWTIIIIKWNHIIQKYPRNIMVTLVPWPGFRTLDCLGIPQLRSTTIQSMDGQEIFWISNYSNSSLFWNVNSKIDGFFVITCTWTSIIPRRSNKMVTLKLDLPLAFCYKTNLVSQLISGIWRKDNSVSFGLHPKHSEHTAMVSAFCCNIQGRILQLTTFWQTYMFNATVHHKTAN